MPSLNIDGVDRCPLKIFVGYSSHVWRKQAGSDRPRHGTGHSATMLQVTLPKGWLASPCERLKLFVVKSYNQVRLCGHRKVCDLIAECFRKAHPSQPDIDAEAHLSFFPAVQILLGLS